MEKLWLAQFKFDRYFYMNGSKQDKDYTYRLVEAKSEEDAKHKVKDRYEYSSEGGDSRYVTDFSATETIK